MQRFRRKKLKSPLDHEGSQQIHRQRNTQNLASDFSSFGCSSVKEYSASCELDGSSSRRISGLPIKKLLAQELSKETEAKRRSPNVVARLMGFDGLPSQQPNDRQWETNKQKTTSGAYEMRRNSYDSQLYMESSKENPEFKDVYVVSEARECVKPKHSDSEMSLIPRKFLDAKRLSAYYKSHNSKELCDNLDALDTNKDLLIQFPQQPDSLHTSNLHDLQGASSISQCHRQISKKCENKTIDLKSRKRTSHCNSRYPRDHLGSLSSNCYSPYSPRRSPQPFEIQLMEQHEKAILPTRIVVLKPNLEKLQNYKKPVSLQRTHVKYPSHVREGARQLGVKPLPGDGVFYRPHMRESRERAKAIIRRMSENLGNNPIELSSIFQGYAGDESSYSASGSESGSELEEAMISSRKSFHWNNRQNATSSYLHESSISREATRRLSKRWNMSQRYRDAGSVGEVSKLGEMLGKPVREMRRDKLDPMLAPDMCRDRVLFNDIMDSGNPFNINCRDDWEERYIRNVSKSGFVSDSSVSCHIPESSTHCRSCAQDGKVVYKEPANRERSKAIKESVYSREDSPFKNQRSGNPKFKFCDRSVDGAVIVENDQSTLNIGEKITSSTDTSLVSKIPVGNDKGPQLMAKTEADVEHKRAKPSPCLLGINNSSEPDPEDSKRQIKQAEENLVQLQCPVPEIQSLANSEEADHLSPISVLEASLTEDISSGSECFENVSADLHELRMQLKLLRMESGEDGNLVLSDKDDSQESFSDTDENAILEYSTWPTSYMVDTLKESGFDSTDPNMIIAIWHSFECPIGPWVFDKLEKKYFNDKTMLKSDRRLLFNRINCGLSELFWWLVDPHPWVGTGRRKFGHGWAKNGARYELQKLLSSEENDSSEKMLDQEMEWLDFGDEVDVIGVELENLLVNGLIEEFTNLLAF